jgi:hypothetical protein
MRLTCALFAFACFACGQASRPLEADPPGEATLRFRMALPAGLPPDQIREAALRISAPDMDTVETALAVAGTDLVGEAEGVPAGMRRKLEAFAGDAAGKRILAGELLVDIEAGAPVDLILILQRVGRVRLDATFDTGPSD